MLADRLRSSFLVVAICAPLAACGGIGLEVDGGTGNDGGIRSDYSDPQLLADKYVWLQGSAQPEFCEYFNPGGQVFGIGGKGTTTGRIVLDGVGSWGAIDDRVCATYDRGGYCMHVLIHETSIDWFSEDDEYLYTTEFDTGARFVGTNDCGTRERPEFTLEIVGIRITSWPQSKPNGSNWDSSPIASYRRPDLRVYLEDLDAAPGTSNSRYTSSIFSNAHSQSHFFTGVANDPTSNDNLNPRLPVFVPYRHRFRVILRDDDFGGAFDDELGRIVEIPIDIASTIDDFTGQHTFTFEDNADLGVTFQVVANWRRPEL